MLMQLMMGHSTKVWTLKFLPIARVIRKNSTIHGKALLGKVYKELSEEKGIKKLQRVNCYDIVQGLKEDWSLWMAILSKFIEDKKMPKARFVYDILYKPLKRLLVDVDFRDEAYYNIWVAFCKVLLTVRKATSADWDVIFDDRVQYINDVVISALLLEISDVTPDQKYFPWLLRNFFTESCPGPQNYFASARLMQLTMNPESLALGFIEFLDKKVSEKFREDIYSESLWNLFLVIVRIAYTPQVHEKMIALVTKAIPTDGAYPDNSTTVPCGRLILFIAKANLCTTENYNKQIQYLLRIAQNSIRRSNMPAISRYFLSSFIFCQTEKLPSTVYGIKIKGDIVNAAFWINAHRYRPEKIQVSQIIEFFEKFYSTTENLAISFATIDIFTEFHEEPYFQQFKASRIQVMLHDTRTKGFAPYLLCLESEKNGNGDPQISRDIRKYLLEPNRWLQVSKDAAHRKVIGKIDRLEILERVAKRFRNDIYDSLLVIFATSLYFLKAGNLTAYFSIPMLHQLAQSK
jgi:hypothetical protein